MLPIVSPWYQMLPSLNILYNNPPAMKFLWWYGNKRYNSILDVLLQVKTKVIIPWLLRPINDLGI